MKRKIIRSYVLLPLFLLILHTNMNAKRVTEVKAEANTNWTEVETITNGKHYIISATDTTKNKKYYLNAEEHPKTPAGIEFLDVEDLSLDDAWTFIGDDSGYVITSAGGHRLHVEGAGTIAIRSAINFTKMNLKPNIWELNDYKLKFNNNYLGLAIDGSSIHWRSPDKLGASKHFYNLTFYEYNAPNTDEITRFSSVMDAWFAGGAQGKCEEFVPPLLTYYDGLSSDAKDEFTSNERYGDLTYFMNWHAARESMPVGSPLNITLNEVPLISVTLFSGLATILYFFISRHKKQT